MTASATPRPLPLAGGLAAARAAPAQTGGYDVLFELAQGGMGAVYLARAVGEPVGMGGFERLVAIKRLHLHLTGRADSVQRFLEEAKVAARIHHANVVGIHQVGSDESGHFLVQDYVEGDTLQGLVDYAIIKRRRLPPPIVLRIALDALAGLAAVHEATDADGGPLGILHRDVSTQNLLVGRDGVTRLADFGIAKHATSSVVTDGHYMQGRVLYMAPEYLARRPIDQRFDVYGMGMTLFIALAGDAPWPGASDAQIVRLATAEGVPPLSASGLAIAPAIEAIVARACHLDPEARFPSARAMLEAIEEIGRHTGWVASHGEVATLVEELAGRELAARRAAVARARGGASTGGTPRATSVTVLGGKPRTSRAAVAAGGLALLVVVGGLLAAARAERSGKGVAPDPVRPPATDVRPAASAVPPSSSASVQPASTTAPSAAPTEAPALPPPAPSPPSPSPASRAPLRHTAEPRTHAPAPPTPPAPPTAAPAPAPAPAPPPPAPPPDLKGIPGGGPRPLRRAPRDEGSPTPLSESNAHAVSPGAACCFSMKVPPRRRSPHPDVAPDRRSSPANTASARSARQGRARQGLSRAPDRPRSATSPSSSSRTR